ncbi:MAG: ribonucleotide-diphosphate reductase subunit beta [Rickettsiales bacterium]
MYIKDNNFKNFEENNNTNFEHDKVTSNNLDNIENANLDDINMFTKLIKNNDKIQLVNDIKIDDNINLNIEKLGAKEISYSLLTESKYYKPFRYPWAYEAWFAQQKMHWLSEEVTMSEDIRDWKDKLTSSEKNLLTQIFRFFTQSDIEVNNCYMMKYQRVFGPIEVKMMLSAFSNMETIHIDAYSKLIETIGMPETTYSAFLQYKEMKDKYEYMQKFDVNNLHNIALTLAVFGAFTEGLQLFSSFAILLNFPRFNKMKGMGQIVTWSVRDESLHTASIIKLFKVFLQENPQTNTEQLRGDIYRACTTIVHFEDAFIDRAFEVGDVHGLTSREVKQYIRYLADRRLLELGLKEVYMIEKNPLPWLEEMLNTAEFANFFEARATTYAKSSTEETWEKAFQNFDNYVNKNS